MSHLSIQSHLDRVLVVVSIYQLRKILRHQLGQHMSAYDCGYLPYAIPLLELLYFQAHLLASTANFCRNLERLPRCYYDLQIDKIDIVAYRLSIREHAGTFREDVPYM